MALVAAKCTECGASIEVDDSKEAGICKHCGTAFVTQRTIHNYNTFVTKNIIIDGEAKNDLLKSANLPTLQAAEERCKKLYELKDYPRSTEIASEIVEKWPESYIGYAWLIKNFEEYRNFNTPEYKATLQRRVSSGVSDSVKWAYAYEHPIYNHYKSLLTRIPPEKKLEFLELIRTAKKIISDFHIEYPKRLREKTKKCGIRLAVSTIALAISILLFILFVNVTAVFVIMLLGIMGSGFSTLAFGIYLLFFIITARKVNDIKYDL